ncbi:hypothetical protein CBL_09960 [Carabus blaptoides fortunei]
MDNKIKRKGGAEKLRLKKQKVLEASAQKCDKLTNVFACPHSSTSNAVAGTLAETEVGVTNSSYQDQELVYIEHQLDDQKSEIEQEHITTQHADAADLATSELQTEEDINAIPSFNYFVHPEKCQLDLFFKYHPKQDISDPVLKKAIYRKDGSNRKWLTYSEKQNALFCSVCIAFSSSSSPFIREMEDRRHVHVRVEEHEKTETHRACAEAYFLRNNNANLDYLLFYNQMSVHRAQIRKRKEILQRIIDIVKFIGKRGLSYRGDKLEAAYSLEDMSTDHGNFLELVVLLSKYDMNLKDHLEDCIENSKKLHESQKGKGRGSLLTGYNSRHFMQGSMLNYCTICDKRSCI